MGKHYWLVAHNSSRSFLYVYGSGVSFFPFFQASVYRYELYWKKKIIKDTTDLQQSVFLLGISQEIEAMNFTSHNPLISASYLLKVRFKPNQ